MTASGLVDGGYTPGRQEAKGGLALHSAHLPQACARGQLQPAAPLRALGRKQCQGEQWRNTPQNLGWTAGLITWEYRWRHVGEQQSLAWRSPCCEFPQLITMSRSPPGDLFSPGCLTGRDQRVTLLSFRDQPEQHFSVFPGTDGSFYKRGEKKEKRKREHQSISPSSNLRLGNSH